MTERDVAQLVAKYLQWQYPQTIYRFDLAADLKLTVGQAGRHKRMHPQRGYPDLFIAEPRGTYHGLYIELKAEGVRLFTKDGRPASEHIYEQNLMLAKLQRRGYAAEFAVGYAQAVDIIDEYMDNADIKINGGTF